MEHPLLAASLRSRHDFELIRSFIDMRLSTYSKPFQIVMAKVGDYYKRDSDAAYVDPSILLAIIGESIRNEKHIQRFTELIQESLAAATSDVNVRACILLAKQQEVGDQLAQALAMDAGAKVDDLLAELSRLRAMTSLDDLEDDGLVVFENVNLADLIAQEFNPEGLIKVYPLSLNERLEGGMRKQHHITVFAPVEAGKTCFCVNANTGFARQGYRTLYGINEDRAEDILLRHISCFTGLTRQQIRAAPERAQELAMDAGFGNIIVVNLAPGTPQQIEDLIEKYEPDCVVIDQLRNLKVKADNRVNQLEAAATAVRTIGKKTDTLMLSVTQAADSATGKTTLETGDIDYSNVGIPAQADVLIGIGFNAEMEAEGTRSISLPKNKRSGIHDSFPVRIQPHLSRMISAS